MLLILAHVFGTVGKVEVNIKHLNSKDVVLTVLQIYYLDTVSQPNVIWNRENKHKEYNSKSKASKRSITNNTTYGKSRN